MLIQVQIPGSTTCITRREDAISLSVDKLGIEQITIHTNVYDQRDNEAD